MENTLNIVSWVLQVILGIKLVTACFTHSLGRSKPVMQEAIGKMGSLAKPLLFVSVLATFLGTIGLILPGILGLSNRITSVVAGVIAVMLLCSIVLHIRAREEPKVFVSLILFLFAVLITIGRWLLPA